MNAQPIPLVQAEIPYTPDRLDRLVQRALDTLQASDIRQVFIGIAGGPGSGKSTLSEQVCTAVNIRVGATVAIVIPMDGYHIARARLQELANEGKIVGDPDDTAIGRAATYEEAISRRGAPWTFDPQALYTDLKLAKEKAAGSFPIYSRTLSDPIMNGVQLHEKIRIVFCEGNYLLAFDHEDWKPLKEIWDDRWYIHVPEDIVTERLIARHLETWTDEKTKRFGPGREGALKKCEMSDLKNSRWIETHCRPFADLIVHNA